MCTHSLLLLTELTFIGAIHTTDMHQFRGHGDHIKWKYTTACHDEIVCESYGVGRGHNDHVRGMVCVFTDSP